MKDITHIVPTDHKAKKSCFVEFIEDFCIVKHLYNNDVIQYMMYHQTVRRRYWLFGEKIKSWELHEELFFTLDTKERMSDYIHTFLADGARKAKAKEQARLFFCDECIPYDPNPPKHQERT